MEKLSFDTGLLNDSENRNISLYIHIPFCAAKCEYCDFFSVPYRAETAESVLKGTSLQVQRYLDVIRPDRILTLYFGGGTPSIIPPQRMRRFVQKIFALSPGEQEEVTVEANPESLTEEHLYTFAETGITRISLGLQSVHEDSLRFLGRPGTEGDSLRALSLLSRKWEGDVNIDLMCGIPGETAGDLQKSIETVLDTGPSHLSLYMLTIHEGTPLEQNIRSGKIEPKQEDRLVEEWRIGIELIETAGYERYEVSNFAAEGKRCLHNLRYWRMLPYIGCGPGASSTLFTDNLPVRIENSRKLDVFCAEPFRASSIYRLTPGEYLLEYLLMGLRLFEGITFADFEERFGRMLLEKLTGLLRCGQFEGLVRLDGGGIRCTRRGIEILDTVLVDIAAGMDIV